MRYLSVIIVLASFVSACQTSQTSSVEAGMQVQIHRQALLYAPGYAGLDREKVMVACIDWANSNLPQLSICQRRSKMGPVGGFRRGHCRLGSLSM
jgi:hypothetical protein